MKKAIICLTAFTAAATLAQEVEPFSKEPRTHIKSPWSMASGAEWMGEYPRFNPLIRAAGVRSIRLFPEWQGIQPRKDEWNWASSDKMAADARKNDIELIGGLWYFAPWASADGGTRKGPVKDMTYWQDYARACFTRYKNDIHYWEIWNEFNGSFYQGKDKPKEYADLTVAAYNEAKKVSKDIQIGIGVANFDVGFLDATIKAGAANHFDFVCVHPYENLGMAMAGEEASYLSLAKSLRDMLAANNQRKDIALWITETGVQTTVQPNEAADQKQAEAMVKVYVLSMAQGFERVCWFEVRGPQYGKGTDHGIIRADWTLRPAYDALKNMTTLLGDTPKYLGWHKVGKDGFGFVFQGAKEPVMVAWASKNGDEMLNINGKTETLTRTPRFFTALPANFVAQVKANAAKPFPWGDDYATKTVATLRLGGTNIEQGIKQVHEKTTLVENGLVESWRKINFKHGSEGRYMYFRTDPTFCGFADNALEITVVARRAHPDKPAGCSLLYESKSGYKGAPGGYFDLKPGDAWQEHTWKVADANFVGAWGWNFRTESTGSPNEIAVKEVRVKKVK